MGHRHHACDPFAASVAGGPQQQPGVGLMSMGLATGVISAAPGQRQQHHACAGGTDMSTAIEHSWSSNTPVSSSNLELHARKRASQQQEHHRVQMLLLQQQQILLQQQSYLLQQHERTKRMLQSEMENYLRGVPQEQRAQLMRSLSLPPPLAKAPGGGAAALSGAAAALTPLHAEAPQVPLAARMAPPQMHQMHFAGMSGPYPTPPPYPMPQPPFVALQEPPAAPPVSSLQVGNAAPPHAKRRCTQANVGSTAAEAPQVPGQTRPEEPGARKRNIAAKDVQDAAARAILEQLHGHAGAPAPPTSEAVGASRSRDATRVDAAPAPAKQQKQAAGRGRGRGQAPQRVPVGPGHPAWQSLQSWQAWQSSPGSGMFVPIVAGDESCTAAGELKQLNRNLKRLGLPLVGVPGGAAHASRGPGRDNGRPTAGAPVASQPPLMPPNGAAHASRGPGWGNGRPTAGAPVASQPPLMPSPQLVSPAQPRPPAMPPFTPSPQQAHGQNGAAMELMSFAPEQLQRQLRGIPSIHASPTAAHVALDGSRTPSPPPDVVAGWHLGHDAATEEYGEGFRDFEEDEEGEEGEEEEEQEDDDDDDDDDDDGEEDDGSRYLKHDDESGGDERVASWQLSSSVRRPGKHFWRPRASPSSRAPHRNVEPSRVATAGFAEIGGLLEPSLCARLAALPTNDAEAISNSYQLEVDGSLRGDVMAQLLASAAVAAAVDVTFGVREFRLTTIKVLMTELGAEPQIPHADDHCNRELFGVIHLRPGQAATECAPYNAAAKYPTGVSVQCETCQAWSPLPDLQARRRDHLAERSAFTCEQIGRSCGVGCTWEDDEKRDLFALAVTEAFEPLLGDPRELIDTMAPCGAPPGVGDGIIALPTLIHRGPGGPDDVERLVLFFSVAPVFSGTRAVAEDVGAYDSNAQIHAGWLLWRAEDVLLERSAATRSAYSAVGFELLDFRGKGAKQRYGEKHRPDKPTGGPPPRRKRATTGTDTAWE